MGHRCVPPQFVCKEYLAVLLEVGHLRREIGRDGAAAWAFVECAELDGDGEGKFETDTRDRTVRTYTLLKKYQSAIELYIDAQTTWTAYAAALLPHLSNGGIAEETDGDVRAAAAAVRAHPLVAWIFANAAIKTASGGGIAEAVEEVDGAPPGTAAETLEYGANEQMDLWAGCALARACLGRALRGVAEEGAAVGDADWAGRLDAEERAVREGPLRRRGSRATCRDRRWVRS